MSCLVSIIDFTFKLLLLMFLRFILGQSWYWHMYAAYKLNFSQKCWRCLLPVNPLQVSISNIRDNLLSQGSIQSKGVYSFYKIAAHNGDSKKIVLHSFFLFCILDTHILSLLTHCSLSRWEESGGIHVNQYCVQSCSHKGQKNKKWHLSNGSRITL